MPSLLFTVSAVNSKAHGTGQFRRAVFVYVMTYTDADNQLTKLPENITALNLRDSGRLTKKIK
jgi:hypothetical protein